MSLGLQQHIRYLSLVLIFAFCHIVGAMCATPDLALAQGEGVVALAGEMMACPMDGWLTCPPSMISSPDRETKQGWSFAVDQSIPSGLAGSLSDVRTMQVFMGSDSSPPCTSPLCASFPVLRI